MPITLDALLRYHSIDTCLQDYALGCTLDFLAERCTQDLIEKGENPHRDTVSKRTIQNDIKNLRGDKLGYNAPIVVKDGKYSYSEKTYSIGNVSLTNNDIINISAAVKMLKSYKGAVFFSGIESLVDRLERNANLNLYGKVQSIVAFEHFPESSGTDMIKPLMDAITKKEVINVTYLRFGLDQTAKNQPFHPYLLKEYHNRWYVLGMNNQYKEIQTFALDRIKKFEVLTDIQYDTQHKPDPDVYFKDTIGVTIFHNAKPVEIKLRFNQSKLPYIKSQPLHESQWVIEETEEYITIGLRLTLNFELQSLIMSFADEVEVLQPASLRSLIKKRINKASDSFNKERPI
ncbi:putative transcriptional regulator [Arcticibacter svalbardensis MN12-7]|uniref:Putative transcriptional regulator n=1 Tax=Arcticibacter svalbardensis MN12-7 TaxID=1150600 RepID=R9GUQ8_9SPHI|nr:WYL domain-containing protein [Arcticibacter svalbardensis]EOR95428.1 putative transcriptional regulator [Arcticibacter svalbardensis MN12-7]